jgi:hypothetical protein
MAHVQTFIPPVIGLNVPQAAAVLHRAGLTLGALEHRLMPNDTGSSSLPVGRVIGQMPDAGSAADVGYEVSLVVELPANVAVIYDDNDLTLLNLTGREIDLASVSISGGGQVLSGSRWRAARLPSGRCVQAWSISRAVSKPVEGCEDIGAWFATLDRTAHVWMSPEAAQFELSIAGVPVMTCPTAPTTTLETPLRCAGYWSAQADGQNVARFLYLAYTMDALVARNPSSDYWMYLDRPLETGSGQVVHLSAADWYESVLPAILSENAGKMLRLAPEECAWLRAADSSEVGLPQACGLIAAEGVQDAPFWREDFSLMGFDGVRRACAAAVSGRLTICVLQR